jgi:hypothetical protein
MEWTSGGRVLDGIRLPESHQSPGAISAAGCKRFHALCLPRRADGNRRRLGCTAGRARPRQLTPRAALPYGHRHGDDSDIGRLFRANYPPGSLT